MGTCIGGFGGQFSVVNPAVSTSLSSTSSSSASGTSASSLQRESLIKTSKVFTCTGSNSLNQFSSSSKSSVKNSSVDNSTQTEAMVEDLVFEFQCSASAGSAAGAMRSDDVESSKSSSSSGSFTGREFAASLKNATGQSFRYREQNSSYKPQGRRIPPRPRALHSSQLNNYNSNSSSFDRVTVSRLDSIRRHSRDESGSEILANNSSSYASSQSEYDSCGSESSNRSGEQRRGQKRGLSNTGFTSVGKPSKRLNPNTLNRPKRKSDFYNPQTCVHKKFGSMRRNWTFLDLNGGAQMGGKVMSGKPNGVCFDLSALAQDVAEDEEEVNNSLKTSGNYPDRKDRNAFLSPVSVLLNSTGSSLVHGETLNKSFDLNNKREVEYSESKMKL